MSLTPSRSSVAVGVVAGVVLLNVVTRAELRNVQARPAAADFMLADSVGKQIRLSRLKGNVVLLDFWATWCEGCKIEIPWYVEFQQKYKRDGLVAVGVSMDEEGWSKVRPYLADHPIGYPVVIGTDALMKQFVTTGALPVTLLIDRRGKVAAVHEGLVDKRAFEQELQALIAEPKR